jgi:DNA repair protein RadC
MAKKRIPYEPLEIVLQPDESKQVFGNPPRKRVEQAPYKALRVSVALVRDEGYTARTARQITGPNDAHALLRYLADEPQEVFVVLLLNAKNKCVGIHEVHRGTLAHVEVHPADVLRAALVAAARSIIVAHNHPSGEATPSPDDKALTDRLKRACDLLGIPLQDHLIIGEGNDFYSFSTNGLL